MLLPLYSMAKLIWQISKERILVLVKKCLSVRQGDLLVGESSFLFHRGYRIILLGFESKAESMKTVEREQEFQARQMILMKKWQRFA